MFSDGSHPLKHKLDKVKSYYESYGLLQTARVIVLYVQGVFVIGFCIRIVLHAVEAIKRILFSILKTRKVRFSYIGTRILLYPFGQLKRIGFFLINIPTSIRQKAFFLLVNYHPKLLSFMCTNAYLVRKWRKPRVMSKDKKRVLHVISSFDLGGSQRQVINLCESCNNDNFDHQAIEIFPELNYSYRKSVVLDHDRYVRGFLFTRMLGVWVSDRDTRSLQLLQIYKLVMDFKALLPEIVVGWGHEMSMLSFVAASIAKIPIIVFCIRTVNPSCYCLEISPLLSLAHKKMLPFLNGIIVNSSLLQDDYSEWMKIPKEKIYICPNGIESQPFLASERLSQRSKTREQFAISNDSIVILNIGRFSKEKGQMLLAQAYRMVVERFPSNKIYCVLCGDGSTQAEVEDYTKSNGLDKVIFTGRVNNIHSYLSAADIFVMPSDFEGMPNAMMEAMGHGLPCVSTNRTGALDIARNNHEALYIEVGSVEQLAEKLSYLIERPEERRRLGANAKERVQEFSVPKMVSTFNHQLEEIINKS